MCIAIYLFTSCTRKSFSVCNSLLGRASDHVTPQNHPFMIIFDNRTLEYNHFVLQLIQERTESPIACYEYVMYLLCLIAAPPCNPDTSTALLLCSETCSAYDKLISSGLCDSFIAGLLEHLSGFTEVSKAILPYFNAFNCSDPSTYFQKYYTDADCENFTSSCTNIFNPQTQGRFKNYVYTNVSFSVSLELIREELHLRLVTESMTSH